MICVKCGKKFECEKCKDCNYQKENDCVCDECFYNDEENLIEYLTSRKVFCGEEIEINSRDREIVTFT